MDKGFPLVSPGFPQDRPKKRLDQSKVAFFKWEQRKENLFLGSRSEAISASVTRTVENQFPDKSADFTKIGGTHLTSDSVHPFPVRNVCQCARRMCGLTVPLKAEEDEATASLYFLIPLPKSSPNATILGFSGANIVEGFLRRRTISGAETDIQRFTSGVFVIR